MCFYPPDLATDASLPPHLLQLLDMNGMIFVTIFIENMQVVSQSVREYVVLMDIIMLETCHICTLAYNRQGSVFIVQ